MSAARFTVFVYVEIRVGEIARVEIILSVDLQAGKLQLAFGGELVAPSWLIREIESQNRPFVNGIVEKRLVVNYVSIALEDNADLSKFDSSLRALPLLEN